MRHELLNGVRSVLNRVGFDLVRVDVSQPERALPVLLERLGINVVLDVGANDGGYGQTLRKNGYAGRIESFEPTEDAFGRLELVSADDPAWNGHRRALGPEVGTVEINVAGNNAASSSVLPMLDRHLDSAPASRYVSSEEVPQTTLDVAYGELVGENDRSFLKLDVQGFEQQVLAAGDAALAQLSGIQMEVSLQPLYDGAAHFVDLVSHLEDRGFMTVQILRGFHDDEELLQADFVMRRK